MSPRGTNNNGPSAWLMLFWVAVAFVCIQGFFFLKKHGPEIEKKPKVTVTLERKIPPPKPLPPEKKLPRPVPGGKSVGTIAVVIDDWGYNRTHCKQIEELPQPAGIAILPHLPYSREVIDCTKAAGQTPMLHLPLEPFNHKDMFDAGYVLTTTMGASEIRRTLLKILGEMQGVVGVNNHTGSKGSEDEALMTIVLAELKRRGLFFVDSVTSQRTAGGRVAQKLRMHIAKRDVFLDNRNEREAIEAQFADAVKICRENGFVLVIGHDRALSLQIISEQMKKLSAEGFRFVSPVDYIKQNEYPRY